MCGCGCGTRRDDCFLESEVVTSINDVNASSNQKKKHHLVGRNIKQTYNNPPHSSTQHTLSAPFPTLPHQPIHLETLPVKKNAKSDKIPDDQTKSYIASLSVWFLIPHETPPSPPTHQTPPTPLSTPSSWTKVAEALLKENKEKNLNPHSDQRL